MGGLEKEKRGALLICESSKMNQTCKIIERQSLKHRIGGSTGTRTVGKENMTQRFKDDNEINTQRFKADNEINGPMTLGKTVSRSLGFDKKTQKQNGGEFEPNGSGSSGPVPAA